MRLINISVLLLFFNFSAAQQIFRNDKFGFSMEKPLKWIISDNSQTTNNFKENIKLPPEDIKKMLNQNKGTINVATFYKYPIDSVNGIIPTIKINIRQNGTKTLLTFKNSIELSYNSIKNYFPDFKFTISPILKELDHKKGVYSVCTYTVKTKVSTEKVRTIVYAIPVGNQFYQITFMDSEKENCEDYFKHLIETIHLN